MMSFSKTISFLFVVITVTGLIGCAVSHPLNTSEDTFELNLSPYDFVILGPARGSTERFQILGFGFGSVNSFVKAERKAYKGKGGDLLISRTRLKSFEGLMIPGFWLSWLGFENEQDFPLIGTEVFTTSGIAIKIPSWHQ